MDCHYVALGTIGILRFSAQVCRNQPRPRPRQSCLDEAPIEQIAFAGDVTS